MLDAIARIERQAARGKAAFEADEVLQTYFVHLLQILGEAAQGLPAALRDAHPEVPWAKIRGMRNVLVHGYFEVDLEIVWAAVERDLPLLRAALQAILDAAGT